MKEVDYKEILDAKIAKHGDRFESHQLAVEEYHKRMSITEERSINHAIEFDRQFNQMRKSMRNWVVKDCGLPKTELRSETMKAPQYFYLCLEILEGKHNEFLKRIIVATDLKTK